MEREDMKLNVTPTILLMFLVGFIVMGSFNVLHGHSFITIEVIAGGYLYEMLYFMFLFLNTVRYDKTMFIVLTAVLILASIALRDSIEELSNIRNVVMAIICIPIFAVSRYHAKLLKEID